MFKKRLLVGVVALAASLTLVGCDAFDKNGSKKNGSIVIRNDASGSDAEEQKESKTGIGMLEDENIQKKVKEIDSYIDNFFYFDRDGEKQEESFYDGIMEGLEDPYSVYYTKDEYTRLVEDNKGEFSGIGATVTQDSNKSVRIVNPIKGSPAEKAGLKAEDLVVEVDGVEIIEQDLSEVVSMLRGDKGTKVHVKLYRPSINDYYEVDITRDVIETETVSYKVLDNNIGYIAITQFVDNTTDHYEEAVDKLTDEGVDGIIVDLRDNPGGLLNAVVDMCAYTLDCDTIVTVKDRQGNIVKDYSDKDKHSVDLPIVVLINSNSASAAEIYSGALQDTGKAKLVGVTTYGKGIVQSVFPLSDGSAIKLTVAKYFTPKGRDIHGLGIEPDYEVELEGRTNAVDIEYEDDLQLQKAEEVMQDMIK